MWYAESRLVSVLFSYIIGFFSYRVPKGPERIKGAYAYHTLLE